MCTIDKKSLEQAYRISAKIVQLYGDDFLPLFERVHKELKQVTDLEDLKKIAMAVSFNN